MYKYVRKYLHDSVFIGMFPHPAVTMRMIIFLAKDFC